LVVPDGTVKALVDVPDAADRPDASALDAPGNPGIARLPSRFAGRCGRVVFGNTIVGAGEFVPRGVLPALTRIPPGTTAFVPPAEAWRSSLWRASIRFVRIAAPGAASGVATSGGEDWAAPRETFAGMSEVAGAAAFVPSAMARDRACSSVRSLFVPKRAGVAFVGSGANEGVCAHKPKPVRSKVSSVFFTVI
jgi:hypothetical protein